MLLLFKSYCNIKRMVLHIISFRYTQKVAEIEHWQASLSASIFGSLKTAAESVLKCQIKTAAQKAAVCFIA